MPDFDCYDDNRVYVQREFPNDALGLDEWYALIERLNTLDPASDQDPLEGLIRARRMRVARPLQCPRVFISHRQADAERALRVAYDACTEGFNYWLDILDPSLAALGAKGPLLIYREAVKTAAIIELALINCTHVVAVITDHTPGTLWVPYEYGRVKDSTVTSVKVSAWFDPKRKVTAVPEYMLLGVQHADEDAIRQWFRDELARWLPVQAACPPRPWPRAKEPDALPAP